MLNLIYPADYFSPRKPDEQFQREAAAFQALGASIATINTDQLDQTPIHPKPAPNTRPLYRGWMLNASTYAKLVQTIESSGAVPFTSTQQYLLAHHIPNWCELLRDFTPETVVLPNGSGFEAELTNLGWSAFFIKDYVKSLKTAMGSIITKPSQINQLVAEMEAYRGEIEGGLCVRRVEEFIPSSEIRYFVLNGQPVAPHDHDIPTVVYACAERIASPFFSVDVIKRTDGVDRIVEIGDGQVSDLVGWSVEQFVDMFRSFKL